jgi:hypothetical protein
LLVDVDPERRLALQGAVRHVLPFAGHVDAFGDFASARACLMAHPPRLLATDSRLGAYNGLHLAYLAAALNLPTRVVVYGDGDDLLLAKETQRAGAFFVPRSQIAAALPAYLAAKLPAQDRRAAERPDRRDQPRGGRRVTDLRVGAATLGRPVLMASARERVARSS